MDEKSDSKAYKFLSEHDSGVLSTVNSNGKPNGAFIYYFADEDLNLYFITKNKTRKYQNIKDNPNIAFTITEEKRRFTLQAEGEASEVKDDSTQKTIMNQLAKVRGDKDNAWFPPIAQLDAGEYVLIKARLTHIQIADFANFRHSGSDVIEQVKV